MNKPTESIFATRSTVTLELPLANTRILHPEQVILKIGDRCLDLGAFCYALRSHEKRKPSQPCQVVLGSFIKQRPNQVLQFMKALSRLITDSGMAPLSVSQRFDKFKLFLDWADSNNLHDCLSGGNATRHAYLTWVEESYERYRLQEISGKVHNRGTLYVREFLDALTGINDLHSGTRKAKSCNNPNGGTAPLALGDFVHAVALNQALFDGLCDLVLEQSPFPYKMVLPSTLGWAENHLWIFPANLWRLPPHQWGAEREKLYSPCWAHDYSAGRLATPDEIAHRYGMRPGCPLDQRRMAKQFIALAQHRINVANADVRDRKRIMLGMIAHNAFLFLFFSNAGANVSVAREIETHGNIRPTTLNQQYKSIKFRAGAKLITLVVPASFMPSLRRFMELRRYLLNGKDFPYLFFTLGQHNAKPPRQIGQDSIKSLYDNMLRAIDPQLPLIGPRKLRASMADWYQRHHDASVTAKVLQNSERTVQRNYDAGSVIDHCDELSLFLNAVSDAARRQRVISEEATGDGRPLEEGGRCDGFGHPEALVDRAPVKPNCKDSQGCLFCTHRVLISCEEDVRKVASAAFVMEQVILGPKHEEALRPLIAKCDEDLEKIATFGKCRAMVERVRNDVFQNGNLTFFFADKYQLFLELGVIA